MSAAEWTDEDLRWARAASWARGQSLGPYGQGVDDAECRHIEQLRDRILAVGEDAAWAEFRDKAFWRIVGRF